MEQSDNNRPPPLPPWAVLLFFLGLGLALYSPVFTGEYACDGRTLMQRMHALPLGEWSALWNPDRFAPVTGILSWRPLSALMVMLVDDRILGAHAALSHLLSLSLHGINAWLVFLFLCRLLRLENPTGTPPHGHTAIPTEYPALIGGLFFLLHPLNSEAVLCMGFRSDLVCTALLLCMARLILHDSRVRSPSSTQNNTPPSEKPAYLRHLATVGTLFAVALLFKEVAAAGLALLPLLLLFRRGGGRQALALFSVLIAIFAIFIWLWFRFQARDYPAAWLGGEGRLLGMTNGWTAWYEVYLRKLAYPWPLQINYVFAPVKSLADPRFLLAAGLGGGLLAGLVFFLRRNRAALFGMTWVVACFLPYLQLVPIPDPVAERFAYVSMAGIAMTVGAIVGQFWPQLTNPRISRFILGSGLLLALCYAGLAFRRSFDWRTDIRLNLANWEATADTRSIAWESRGALYLIRAEEECRNNDLTASHESLALAGQALARFREMAPLNSTAWRLSAAWAIATQQPEQAKLFIREALHLNPADETLRRTAAKLGMPPVITPDARPAE